MRRYLIVFVLVTAAFGLLAAPAFANCKGHAAVICVRPSGGDDTANIQAAFDKAIAAGPGSTVRLSAGHFHMNNILVDGFKGCFTGAGMHRTVIDTLRGLDPGLPGVTLTDDPDDPGQLLEPWTFLIGFLRSNVRVADMSFDVTAYDPSEPYLWDPNDPASGTLTDLSDVFLVTRDSSSAFDRVGIKAHDGDMNGFNIEGCIALDSTGGVHSVTRCCFVGHNGLEMGEMTGGKLTIGGRAGMGNSFDMYGLDCYLPDFSDSRIEASHNYMRTETGATLFITQGTDASSAAELPPLPAPRYVICDNTMIVSHATLEDGTVLGAGGVMLWDDSWRLDARSRLCATVAHNAIRLDNLGWGGGVDGIGAKNVRVQNNRIWGTGVAGIDAGTEIYASYFGIPLAPACGWQIIGNDVSGVKPLNAMGGPAAPIWLGTESSHCLVVGGCRPTTVLDQGTDNILINVNEMLMSASAQAGRLMKPLGRTSSPKLHLPKRF